MFENGNPFRKLERRSKIALASILGAGLLLATILPVMNIPVLPAAIAADDKGKMLGHEKAKFDIMEATIEDIQNAIKTRQITATDLVNMYLERIKAYNGVCVDEPEGILGPISTIPNAGQLNALSTLNLRPDAREEWGFDERKARSMTDLEDDDPNMPDALEVAAALDEEFAKTGKLVGPLHGVVFSIKDAYDTFDMRTTSGADAFYENDRPPDDAEFVKRLRDAGAIILAKANLSEYQDGQPRSSFGGTFCNPYDTEREAGISSTGSGTSVAANLVTCSFAEETGSSIRGPAKAASAIGLSPTRELVSADGMIQQGWNTRVGPICRTVEDVARVFDVYAGFDPKDEMTAFSINRMPSEPYQSFTEVDKDALEGIRIGVVREYMDKELFTEADHETIDIIDAAIDDLRNLGATIVDPGEGGALFQECVDRVVPTWRNQLFTGQFPDLFPVDEDGNATEDHIPLLADMKVDPSLVPHDPDGSPSVRDLGPAPNLDDKFNFNWYLQERGDSNIETLTDLIEKANHYEDTPYMPAIKPGLIEDNSALMLDNTKTMANRFAMQDAIFLCFAEHDLDAVVYPTGNIPNRIITNPREPEVNDRGNIWTEMNRNGFPAMTVPAGFTTHVFDREFDPAFDPVVRNETILVGPVPAELPVGIDFLGLPFDEPTLFKIASAYEAATQHRTPPPDFGPLDDDDDVKEEEDDREEREFSARLTGEQEVPPVDTEASGEFEMELDEDGESADYELSVEDIEGVTAAHVHIGSEGENGDIVVPLETDGLNDGESSEGAFDADDLEGPLEGQEMSDLIEMIEDDEAYANVHTEQNPDGEIRGQISED